jgi:hypothetical protein
VANGAESDFGGAGWREQAQVMRKGDAKLQAQAIWLGASAVANFAGEARLGGGGTKEGKGEMAGGSAI